MNQMMNGNGTAAVRPLFFPRQMVGPSDLTQLLNYLRERQRRHNRALHGWGVVYGADVVPVVSTDGSVSTQIQVTPGFILTPSGDEIEITFDQVLDPTKLTAGGDSDPWHSTRSVDAGPPKGIVYLAVRYQEVQDSPVRVPPVACGCNDQPCVYARARDSYEFRVLDQLPASHSADKPGPLTPADQPGQGLATGVVKALSNGDDAAKARALLTTFLPQQLSDVPATADDDWVVLAALQLTQGQSPVVDPVSPRRNVVSLAPLWWRPLPSIDKVVVQSIPTDQNNISRVKLTVTGENLFPMKLEDVTLPNTTVESLTRDPTTYGRSLTVQVSFPRGMAQPPQDLTIRNSVAPDPSSGANAKKSISVE
jgi:hypothetical protein